MERQGEHDKKFKKFNKKFMEEIRICDRFFISVEGMYGNF